MIFVMSCKTAPTIFAQQISAENARSESLVSQLKVERVSTLDHLRAQLRLANKLNEFATWEEKLRAALAARIAVAETAEVSIQEFHSGAKFNGSRLVEGAD